MFRPRTLARSLPSFEPISPAKADCTRTKASFITALERNLQRTNKVTHGAKKYVRGDVTTNTVEGYFSIFKRGMRGVYQHGAEKNLHRYLAEFDCRYNTRDITDGQRAVLAAKSGEGKGLTHRQRH